MTSPESPSSDADPATGLDPSRLKGRLQLAQLHVRRGRLASAADLCASTPHKEGQVRLWEIELGRLALRIGDFETALELFSRLEREGGGAGPAGEIELALQGLKRDAALGIDPQLKRRYLSAFERMARGEYAAAEALFRETIRSAPAHAPAWLGLRGALMARGRPEEAEALATAFRSVAPVSEDLVRAVMGRPLSARGLPFDPHEPVPIVGRAGAVARAHAAADLRRDGDWWGPFDHGGKTIRHPPTLIPVGRPQDAIAPVQVTPKAFLLSLEHGAVVGRGVALTRRGELIGDVTGPDDGPKIGARGQDGAILFDPDRLMGGQCQVNVFDRPAIMMVGPTDTSWGDWVTNFAPRLRIAEAAGLGDAAVLVNAEAPAQHLQLLEALGIARGRMLPHRTDQVSILPRLYVPSWPLRDRHRPMEGLFDVYRRLRPSQLPADRPRLYVSRENVSNRPLVNEPQVRVLFERAGFEVIVPERLSFEETRRLFAAPACVAGPYGSAFRNLAFSAGGPRCFTIMPPYPDSFLPGVALWLALLGLQCSFVRGQALPADGGPNVAPWTVDLGEVERGLADLLAGLD